MKQYILIRTDKKFPNGKLLVHAGHNCISAILPIQVPQKVERITTWLNEHGMRKIVVNAGSDKDIKTLIAQAEKEDIPNSYIKDHNTGIRYCGVIGPVTDEESYHLGLADLELYRE